MKKNNFLLMLVCFFISYAAYCQGPTSFLLDLEILEHGSYEKVAIEDRDGEVIGYYFFEKRADGKTTLSVDLPRNDCNAVKVKYYKNKEVFFTDIIRNGPSVYSDVMEKPELIATETVSMEEQEYITIAILSIALCCVQMEIGGSTTVDGDGCVTTTSTWGLGFDCDCFSIEASIEGSDGTIYSDVDFIELTLI